MIGTTTYVNPVGQELHLMCLQENLPRSAAVAKELGILSDQQMPEKMQELKKLIRCEAMNKALVNQLQIMEIQQKIKEAHDNIRNMRNQTLADFELYNRLIYRGTAGTIFALRLKTNQNGKYEDFGYQESYWSNELDTKWKRDVNAMYGVCDWIITPAVYDIHTDKRKFENVTHIYSFWADFDAGTIGHKQETLFASNNECRNQVLQNLKTLNLTPTLWFSSGYGFHAYWCITENLIGTLNQGQIEDVNEALYQAAVGSSQHFNETKSAVTLMRSPFPGTNLKIINSPVATKLEQLHGLYDLADIIKRVPPAVTKLPELFQQRIKSGQAANPQPLNLPIKLHRIGDINKVLADTEFMDWIYDSSALDYYKNDKYQHDSQSAKEAWIVFYLWLCELNTEQILDFFYDHTDAQNHLFRTRKKKSAQLELIEYNIRKKCERAEQGQCSAKIKKEHIMEVNWNVN